MYSIFDIFKIGIGPSSSHTVGPMKAARQFVESLSSKDCINKVEKINVELYGSLSFTGRGHNIEIGLIYQITYSVMNRIQISFRKGIIEQLIYNKSMMSLTNVLTRNLFWLIMLSK